MSWPVLLASGVGVGLGNSGIPFYTFGLFVQPLSRSFHWSRGQISTAMLFFMIGTVVISPFVGSVLDRFGARSVALMAQAGLALGFALLATAGPAIWTFYCAWLALSVLGAGTSPIVWTRAVAGAFVRRRGLALGIALSGSGWIAVLAPWVVSRVIASFGWATADLALAGSLVFFGMPLTFFMLPRGRDDPSAQAANLAGISLAAALHSSLFWRIAVAFVLVSFGVAGLIVHLPTALEDNRLDVVQAASRVAWLGYAIVGGRLLLGFLLDRLPAGVVGGSFIMLASLACLLIAHHAALFAAVPLLGLCTGAEVDLLAYLISRLFGMRHYARIYGCGVSAFSIGPAIGPIVAGAIRDHTGSYVPALYLFAAATAMAAMLIMSLGRALAASPYAPEPIHHG